MKTSNQSKRYQFPVLLGGLIILGIFGSSCMKDKSEPIIEGTAKVMIVNAASGSSSQDFYLNDSKVNTQAVAYSESTSYLSTDAGNGRKAEFRNAGSTTVNFTGYVDLYPNENYTFFYTSKVDGSGNSSAVFKDEKTSPAANKAKLRFVNLAEGFADANLMITAGVTLVSNIAFGTASNYAEVDPGILTLQIINATSSAGLGVFTLEGGKIYTIYTSGSLTGVGQSAVSAKILVHN